MTVAPVDPLLCTRALFDFEKGMSEGILITSGTFRTRRSSTRMEKSSAGCVFRLQRHFPKPISGYNPCPSSSVLPRFFLGGRLSHRLDSRICACVCVCDGLCMCLRIPVKETIRDLGSRSLLFALRPPRSCSQNLFRWDQVLWLVW